MLSATPNIAPGTQVMTIPSPSRPAPLYPFLSRPPQKKRPTQPLPPLPPSTPARPHSAAMSAISVWAAKVDPGSPAPWSPRRSPASLTGRRSSFSRRISGGPGQVFSASFASFADRMAVTDHVAVTPSSKDFPMDLTAVGYTSVFVHFPHTPLSPPISHQLSPSLLGAPRAVSAGSRKSKRALKHLKSLSSLKSDKRSRSKTPPFPSLEPKSSGVTNAHALQASAITKSKKSRYAKNRPAPLANELALAQLMDGGKLDDHVKHYAQAQARAAGATETKGQVVGVGDVWRDREGGVWMDQDEVWEFVHLLGGDEDDFSMDDVEWVKFGSDGGKENKSFEFEHRGSLSSDDSDLNPRYPMTVEEHSQDMLVNLDIPATLIRPGLTMLSIPARPQRTAKHLRKAELLLDVSPLPISPSKDLAPPLSHHTVGTHAKGRARRRPAPLNLTPRSPALKHAHNPADAEELRAEFLQDSFKPRPRRGRQTYEPAPLLYAEISLPAPAAGVTPAAVAPRKILAAKSSLANMKGLFKAIGGKKSTVI